MTQLNLIKAVWVCAALVVLTCSAEACQGPRSITFRDVFGADVVVVGQIGPVEAVTSHQGGSVYGRFDIAVSQVLHGSAPDHLTVTWANQYWSLPKVPTRPAEHVIALRHFGIQFVDKDGREVSFDPPEPGLLTVIDVPCDGGPLIYDADSEQGRAIMEVLDEVGDASSEADALSRTVNLNHPWEGAEAFRVGDDWIRAQRREQP